MEKRMANDWTPPDGMFVEFPPEDPELMFIGKPGGMYVTVDFAKRIYGYGRARPRTWSVLESSPGFTGKGWKTQICDAAALALEDLCL